MSENKLKDFPKNIFQYIYYIAHTKKTSYIFPLNLPFSINLKRNILIKFCPYIHTCFKCLLIFSPYIIQKSSFTSIVNELLIQKFYDHRKTF